MTKIWRPFGFACLTAAALLLITSAVRASSEPSVRITSAVGQGVVRLNAKASGPFDYVVHHPSADLYYIDLTGVSASNSNVAQVLGNDIVRSYRLEQYQSGDQTVSRLEILLGDGAIPKISRDGTDSLRITVSKRDVLVADSQDSVAPRVVDAALRSHASPKAIIRQISVAKNGDVPEVLVLGSGSMNYHELRLSNPARIVLDFESEHILAPKKTPSTIDPIRDVRAAQFSPQVARVVIDLSKDSSYSVKHVDGGVAVEFASSESADSSTPPASSSSQPLDAQSSSTPASAPASASSSPAPADAALAPTSAKSTASASGTSSDNSANAASTNSSSASSNTTGSSSTQAQAAAQPSAPPANPAAADSNSSSNFPKPTEPMAASSSQPPAQSAGFTSAVSDHSATAAAVAPQNPAPVASPAALPPSSPAPAAAQSAETGAQASQASSSTPPQTATAASMMPVSTGSASPVSVISHDQGGAKYTGAPISVNLKSVDLQDFFRLIHEISGLNVVVDPSVRGTLTLVLDNVPWDQALDIVLKNNDLDKELDGNVLRIATKETMKREADEAKALAKAQLEAVDLVTTTRVLSYAKAGDLVDTLKKFLSPRGDILADNRTNTLVISDIPTILPVVDNLIRELDKKTQQVEIEARVVAANRSFARELGSQFAFAGSATGGRNLFGGVGAVGTSPVGRFTPPLPAPPIIVGTSAPTGTPTSVQMPLVTNLGAAVPTSGVSYAFSSANFALDYIITAAESKGVGKLLSKPKEIVQNNEQATIKQGTKIPVQTVINNTISVQFIDAVLELQVTPQITAEGTIFMTIHVENTQIDPAIPRIQGIPALDTQEADTRVLVADGQTVMLGGIIISNQQTSISEVPFVGSLPIIGQLFRHTTISTNSQELLFFVTPRILPM